MRYAKILAAALMCFTAVGPTLAQDELPTWPALKLEFEVSDEPLTVTGMKLEAGVAWPQYAATFVVNEIEFNDRGTIDHQPDDWLLQSPSAERFSDDQRALVRAGHVVNVVSATSLTRRGRGPVQIQVYAVTEQDVRLMSHAALEWLQRKQRASFETKRNRLADTIKELAEKRQRLDELLRAHPDPDASLKEIEKATWYETVEEAQEDMRVLEKDMRSVDVDIAGISAKTASIQQYLQQASAKQPNVGNMLTELQIQQDIEMAGAVARKAALQGHLRQAAEYIEAVQTVKRLKSIKDGIALWADSVDRQTGELKDPERVRVVGAVTIQPIEYPGE